MTLPVPLTSFVGRVREMAAVRELLGASRLVTLTGAAGSGKTRLALAVAQEHAESGEEIAWVSLASLTDPSLLPAHLAAVLVVPEEQDCSPLATLLAALRGRRLLLVLDNCEHLALACADLVEVLLRECPALRILATSREPLAVLGEHAWLTPLLSAEEAVTLFVDRARAVLPAFAAAAETDSVEAICRRLDGLPLAIELAAARVPVLAPAQLLARLDDGLRTLGAGSRTAPPRQRTLRGAIDWSFALLGEAERALLARLAVFPGSFSLTAVERICADDRLPAEGILDALAALVEKSLVCMELRSGEARYRLLEVVRQYARERLTASADEAAVRGRHAAFFLALVEESEEQLHGYGAPAWLAVLDEETPNIRAAGDWLAAAPERIEDALRMARGLYRYWYSSGRFAEGRARLAAVLERSGHASLLARARAMTALGFLSICHGDYAAARGPAAESVSLLRRLDDPAALALSLLSLGLSELLAGDSARAQGLLAEAVETARSSGRPTLIAQTVYWWSNAARRQGDLPAACAGLEEAVALTRGSGAEFVFAYCSARLGVLRHLLGDTAGAVVHLREALAVHRVALGRWGTVEVLDALAGVAVGLGRADRAARLLGASEAICRRMDATAPLDLREFHDQFAGQSRAALGDAAFEAGRAEGLTLDLLGALEEAQAFAESLSTVDAAAVPAPQPSAGPALSVVALGPLVIRRDGRPIPPGAWRAARPRELLLYLLCHRLGRTRDQIALVFWPDASPAQVKNNFHVTLHHLRRALGRSDLVIFDRERYRVHWELGVEFDAADFENEVRAALRAAPGDLPIGRLQSALARYRGDFLSDAHAGDWHLEHRDHLRRLCVDGLLAVGAYEETGRRFELAALAYRRVLAVDGLDEAASRGLIRCLARSGGRAEALREFDRLARLLRAELDAEPDAETVALAERVRRADAV